MAHSGLYVEDLVALKDEPSIRGIVDSTWRDITTSLGSIPASDWVAHSGVPQRIRAQYNQEKRCPRGYVIINFIQPNSGYSLISEKALFLLDRALLFGDVVKRQSSDSASGTVIRSSILCTLLPIYTGLHCGGNTLWPHDEEDNIIERIPGTELRFITDYQVGDLVVYRDWVGEVENVSEELTVRLGNGGVVVLANPDEVKVPGPVPNTHSSDSPLPQVLTRQLDRTLETCITADSVHAEIFHPGQLITTTKVNLRLGRWIYGQYDPSVPPCGIIVEVNIREINVHWKCRNPFSKHPGPVATPPSDLDRGDFHELRVYEKGRSPIEASLGPGLGSVHGSDIAAGDYVRFRDVAGAALKYACEEGSNRMFRRIPRVATQGYEMNVFIVAMTETQVLVQWQDGTTSEVGATSLVPYLSIDEHDLWPGEIVYDSEEEQPPSTADGTLAAKRIGVVQWTDARDRLARVRWFTDPKVSVANDPIPTLLPGSYLGELSPDETIVSLYEIFEHPVLSKRRGGMAIIAPGPYFASGRDEAASPGPNCSMPNPGSVVSSDAAGLHEHPQLDSKSASSLAKDSWFGEIIDLGLDGLLTVRLGLTDPVHDIRVPLESVVAHVDGASDSDEELGGNPDDEHDYSDDDQSWEHSSDGVIRETIEYDGGTRLDADSGDEMWTTDDENGETLPDGPALRKMSVDVPPESKPPAEAIPPPPRQQEYRFTAYESMPPQFELLDEPVPDSHHYARESTTLSAGLMRRIRHEHSILESSLPEGIWVRAWADNITLLRVLIIGPPGTPYSLAPFVLDLRFKADFPLDPPQAHFHSWTNNHGRINPNLYENGTVCLSLLGTWPGLEEHELWNADSSVLQILVSLMGLVLVKEPFYNEAGFEAYVDNPDTQINSALYTEKALVLAKGFVTHALSHRIAGLTSIVEWLYHERDDAPNLLRRVLAECEELLEDGSGFSSGAKVLLRRHVGVMRGLQAEHGTGEAR